MIIICILLLNTIFLQSAARQDAVEAESLPAEQAQPSQIKPVLGQFVMPVTQTTRPTIKPIPREHFNGLPPARVVLPADLPPAPIALGEPLSPEKKEQLKKIQREIGLTKSLPRPLEYSCPFCSCIFTNGTPNPIRIDRAKCLKHLTTHYNAIASGYERTRHHHQCPDCDKKYSSSQALSLHKKTHLKS